MDKLIILTGGLLLIASILFLSREKSKFRDELLIDFEKNIRPKFFIHYLIGLLPVLIFLIGLMTINIEVLNFFWIIFAMAILWDGITIYKLNSLIAGSKFKSDYNTIKIIFIIVLLSKVLVLLGLKFYLETALAEIGN